MARELREVASADWASRAKDVDTALLLGAGWPFFLGGITKCLDQPASRSASSGTP
jgi:hypothetical protein